MNVGYVDHVSLFKGGSVAYNIQEIVVRVAGVLDVNHIDA